MAIITLGGHLGAGKTTVSGILAELLGYEELYVGSIMRGLAAEHGQSIEEFFRDLGNDPALERSIDERQRKSMQERDNVIVQGRLAWFFAKGSPFKVLNVFLAVEPQIGVERLAKKPENAGKSVAEVEHGAEQRRGDELQRYKNLYGVDNFLDPAHYDLLIDTSHVNQIEVAMKIIAKMQLGGMNPILKGGV